LANRDECHGVLVRGVGTVDGRGRVTLLPYGARRRARSGVDTMPGRRRRGTCWTQGALALAGRILGSHPARYGPAKLHGAFTIAIGRPGTHETPTEGGVSGVPEGERPMCGTGGGTPPRRDRPSRLARIRIASGFRRRTRPSRHTWRRSTRRTGLTIQCVDRVPDAEVFSLVDGARPELTPQNVRALPRKSSDEGGQVRSRPTSGRFQAGPSLSALATAESQLVTAVSRGEFPASAPSRAGRERM
jgi:hypothetical protein